MSEIPEEQPWWMDFLQQRNDASLIELAVRFETTVSALVLALQRTSTPRVPSWSAGALRALGPEVPRPNEGPPLHRPGSKDRRIDGIRDQLGRISDRAAAEIAGVSQRTITSYRQRHGIPAFTGRGAAKGTHRRSRVDPFRDLLGTMTDREVAERAGVTVNAVRNYRQSRGIESYRSTVPGAAATEHTRSARAFTWRVGFEDGSTGVVSASDAATAVAVSEGGGKRLVSLQLVGPLL